MRNFTILLLSLLLCSCEKHESKSVIYAKYDTAYQSGKVYQQTFFLKDIANLPDASNDATYDMHSVDQRVSTLVRGGSTAAPSETTVTAYYAYVNKGGLPEGISYQLVVNYQFTYGGITPGDTPTFNLKGLKCYSRFRLVTAKFEPYTFNGKQHQRMVIVEELQESPLTLPKDNTETE